MIVPLFCQLGRGSLEDHLVGQADPQPSLSLMRG